MALADLVQVVETLVVVAVAEVQGKVRLQDDFPTVEVFVVAKRL